MSGTDGSEQALPAERASRELADSTVEVGALRRTVESCGLLLDPAAGEEIRSMLDEQVSARSTRGCIRRKPCSSRAVRPEPATLVTWFDTHQRRYLLVSNDSWLSITPSDNQRIEHRVANVLSKVY